MSAARVPVTHLLYLHGFRSAPQSTKARIVGAWIARHRPAVRWLCPQLPPSPGEALRLVSDATAGWPRATTGIVGSSLGGFYATVLAERLGPPCRAVLLNPAVDPAHDLAAHVGEQRAWHSDERFEFRAAYVDELQAMAPARLTAPERYFAIVAKGDEVLDWRQMSARYAGCAVKLIEGGDHALSDFEATHLADVTAFLGL
jgi:predicted esterase YcpF (UPF0227 family)